MARNIVEKYLSMDYGPAPEDASEVTRWLDAHKRTFGHYIHGAFTAPTTNTFTTTNPATGELLATIDCASPDVVDSAVQAARAALPAWQALTGHQRARYLYALARQVQKHARRLAVLETLDNGKPIRESRDIDIPLVARHFYHHAGWAQLRDEEFVGYAPVGVVGQIIPWNFPLLMFAWKVAPALAAGCTVVIKPAEYTPLTAIAMAEIAHEIGLPAGVLNVIQGDGSVGAALVAHPDVYKIAFTGSTEVGRIIRKATANTSKKISLELGGKSPFIVFDDADLDSAVEGLVDGIWFNQGQVCCAGSRLLVQERVAERFYEKVRTRMQTLRIGSPLDKAVDMGAIVDRVQHDKISTMVADGIADGAVCYQPELRVPETGLFFKPTLLTNISPASTVAQQEIFGPVLVAMSFRTPAEAIELANNTAYGLAASIWSENINVALDAAAKVKAGVVWVNATNLFDAACGFGGYRESGFGREGGREGMYEYLEPTWLRDSIQPSSTNNQRSSPHAPHPAIDRTIRHYIGGKQVRPDSGYSEPIYNSDGQQIGEAPKGNRKDIRNAVEAARSAGKWAAMTAHQRAQVLYFVAENLVQRREQMIATLGTFVSATQATEEFDESLQRVFTYAAWADKFDGSIHNPLARMVTLAMNEAIGTIGILAPDEAPLLGLLSLILPAIAMGNVVVAVPSQRAASVAADLCQIFDTSDLPGGVVNLVYGDASELGKCLAEHDDIDAVWCFRDEPTAHLVQANSTGNLKQVFSNHGRPIDWLNPKQDQYAWFLRHACQVKNIWMPYGE